MLKIALTGGIATGKTYVRARLEALGAGCLEADRLAHGVMEPGTEATRAIAARFGPQVLNARGAVDRVVLGPMVFADREARRELEAIVHPAVWRAVQAALRAYEALGGIAVVVVEVPLLYETGHAADFDRVIATVASEDVQMQRLLVRGLTAEQARQRIAAQMPAEDKARLADYVVRTDGTFEDTDRQVLEIWKMLS